MWIALRSFHENSAFKQWMAWLTLFLSGPFWTSKSPLESQNDALPDLAGLQRTGKSPCLEGKSYLWLYKWVICSIAMLTYWMNGFTKMFHRWWPSHDFRVYTYSLYENTKKKIPRIVLSWCFESKKENKRREMKGNSPSFPPCFLWLFWAKNPFFRSEFVALLRFLSGRRLRNGGSACCLAIRWRWNQWNLKPLSHWP